MTKTQSFNAALDNFIAFTQTPAWSEPNTSSDVTALSGAGADWGVTPSPAYSYFADMSAAVDEAIEEDRVAERAAIWSAVAKTEADYDTAFVKCDGREG